jgi:hypothetical protein
MGSINRQIMVQASQGKKQDPISKITRAKRVGGMVQVGECLPSTMETLSQTSVVQKEEEEEEEKKKAELSLGYVSI